MNREYKRCEGVKVCDIEVLGDNYISCKNLLSLRIRAEIDSGASFIFVLLLTQQETILTELWDIATIIGIISLK